ncbi:MAG TPA: BTAD domain-containing putative transcriptional regulator [Anaerolineae bacterium]|nr:BTAD domain-containing putative transcriptional regulator [Anaerolineae bacterium]HNU02741.1 BTAD domain-containing putative transcriptional regulator [Anaerolineae bacterium]
MLELRFLGQFSLLQDGRPVKLSSRPSQSLLAYLCLHAGASFRREKLAGLLWPEASETSARNNLRQALWRIRKALEEAGAGSQDCLLADDLAIAFDARAPYWLDVEALTRPLPSSPTPADLTPLVAVYGGELLPGFYDEWTMLERERVQAVYERRMAQLLELLVAGRDWTQTATWAERWIALGSTPETAYRSLMIAHAALGDLAAMSAAYQRCVEALWRDLGVEPSEQTTALVEQLRNPQTRAVLLPGGRLAEVIAPDSAFSTIPDEAPYPGEPPFKGLHYFAQEDSELFFGRERLVAELADRLHAGQPFLAIVGASGSGKSSLVRAGLTPALTAPAQPAANLPRWRALVFTPTAHPLHALAAAISKDGPANPLPPLADELARAPGALRAVLASQLPAAGQRWLMVVDQFEELFTLCRSADEQRAFVAALLAAVDPASGAPASLVIALRADFYAQCSQYPALRQALASQQAFIGPMNAEELRRAIEAPALHGGWTFEPGLVDLILRDAGEEPGTLPLLSHALLETWLHRRGRSLTLQAYAEAGGVHGAVARTAETVYNHRVPAELQPLMRSILLRLTELGDAMADTRRRVTMPELASSAGAPEQVQAVLQVLSDARLVTLDQDTVEIAHEALIREWPTLRQWLADDREGLRLHRRLTEAAQAWEEMDRDQDVLYHGARLALAREWAETHPRELNALEAQFLAASAELEERRERELAAQQARELEAARELAETQRQKAEMERRLADEQRQTVMRLRRRALLLTAALAVALALAGLALFLRAQVQQAVLQADANAARAEDERRIAFSRELAAAAVSNLSLDPERSILLAMAAISQTREASLPVPKEAEEALHQALLTSRLWQRLPGPYGVAFSPDGARLATGGPDSSTTVWDVAAGQPALTFTGHSGDRYGVSVQYSPDGRRLVTASADGTAVVWDAATGRQLLRLAGHIANVYEAQFSPDGQRIATSSADGTVRLWDATTGETLRVIRQPYAAGIAFDPTGTRLAVADGNSDADAVHLWDTETGQQLGSVGVTSRGARDADFSPDGAALAIADGTGNSAIWDIQTGNRLASLESQSPVYSVRFSPDGRRVATGGDDGVVKLWDAAAGGLLLTLPGHDGRVTNLDFSPAGDLLATASTDGATRVWDVGPAGSRELLTLPAHDTVVYSVDFSADGSRMATSSWDRRAIIWDASSGELLASLPEHPESIARIAFSPDGASVATAAYDGVLRIWDSAGGEPVREIAAHGPQDIDVAWDPAGQRLVSGGSDATVKIWDAATGALLKALDGHSDRIHRVAFSPDGKIVASASWDGTARLWSADSGELLATLAADGGQVKSVAFSADGSRMATAHEDGARIWDLQAAQEAAQPVAAQTLLGHTGSVWDAAFNPAGDRVATLSWDGTARLWDAATGEELLTLRGENNGPDLAFTPDGRFLATTSGSGAVHVYAAQIDDLLALAQSRLTRTLTQTECQRFLHVDACPE